MVVSWKMDGSVWKWGTPLMVLRNHHPWMFISRHSPISETPEWWLVGWVELVWGAKMLAKICLCLCFYMGCMDIFPRSSQLWKQTNNMIPFDRLGAKFRGERVGIAQPLRSLRSRLLEINSILYNQVEISGKNLNLAALHAVFISNPSSPP